MLIRNLFNIALASMALILSGCNGGVLDPKGQIGIDEKNLIIIATVLMLLVVIPVIVMTLYFAWKYRDTQDHEIYAPKWAHSNKIEAVVWAVPIVIVIILGVITWQSTQDLDPYKPIEGKGEHLTVEVVSLNWKWLFIYPEQGIATVNELVFPANVPVEYKKKMTIKKKTRLTFTQTPERSCQRESPPPHMLPAQKGSGLQSRVGLTKLLQHCPVKAGKITTLRNIFQTHQACSKYS